MACALTQGFNLDCRDSIGGVKYLYIIETGNISSITEASGVVTALTLAGTPRRYNLIRDTSNFSETLTVSEQNGTVFAAQSVEIVINKRQANTRNEIMLLAKNNLTFFIVDNNGKGWMIGREFGLVLGAAVTGSGMAWGDRNGYTLPFAGNEKELAPEIAADVLATLAA
jgi:hypothetical protein